MSEKHLHPALESALQNNVKKLLSDQGVESSWSKVEVLGYAGRKATVQVVLDIEKVDGQSVYCQAQTENELDKMIAQKVELLHERIKLVRVEFFVEKSGPFKGWRGYIKARLINEIEELKEVQAEKLGKAIALLEQFQARYIFPPHLDVGSLVATGLYYSDLVEATEEWIDSLSF